MWRKKNLKATSFDQPVEGRYRVRFLSTVDRWWRQAQAILVAPERATDVRIATDLIPVSATRKRWKVKARVAVDFGSVSTLPINDSNMVGPPGLEPGTNGL